MNYSDMVIKTIGVSALTYRTKNGEIKRITRKKYPDLFKELTAIIKKAEKEKTLWNEQITT